jgi:uncharacterized membrane protein
MKYLAVVFFLVSCASFVIALLVTFVLTRRSVSSAKAGLLERLRLDVGWPFSVLSDKKWQFPRDRMMAKWGRFAYLITAAGMVAFYVVEAIYL